ncbi:hypothetical protein ABIA33_006937 [Streptacidiphilus sp. MAP12-16]|uniref:hypothetical protein n=1 Tax=Streptacidiphilus sp. MAP12-16 TaxID=3156300 RepID=UPI003511B8D3
MNDPADTESVLRDGLNRWKAAVDGHQAHMCNDDNYGRRAGSETGRAIAARWPPRRGPFLTEYMIEYLSMGNSHPAPGANT